MRISRITANFRAAGDVGFSMTLGMVSDAASQVKRLAVDHHEPCPLWAPAARLRRPTGPSLTAAAF